MPQKIESQMVKVAERCSRRGRRTSLLGEQVGAGRHVRVDAVGDGEEDVADPGVRRFRTVEAAPAADVVVQS